MIRAPTRAELAGATVLVLGLGRSGLAASRFLLKLGVRVFGSENDESVKQSARVKRLVRAGLALTARPASVAADLVVASPGLADDHPRLRQLRQQGRLVVDELDLASQFVSGPVIAVTGTNGKSTTTALIAAMLRAAGLRVFCGGNIAPGRPLSAALAMPKQDWYVVEVSSFQLERAHWLAPRVAAILNISPDHLNRHGSLAHYAECKFRLLDRQREDDCAVLGYDDARVRQAASRGRARKLFFSARRRVRGAYFARGALWFEGEQVMPAGRMRLRGRHNLLNALAAFCVVRSTGVGSGPVRKALGCFAGLPHRLEPVRVLRGVEYVNNSMCTNPAAGAGSLEPFDRRVVLIAGGREKNLPVGEYTSAIVRRARWVVLIGESRERMAQELLRRRFRRFDVAQDLRQAVALARSRARHGDVVLFSPGFASFDMFRDFADRGRRFVREVRRLH